MCVCVYATVRISMLMDREMSPCPPERWMIFLVSHWMTAAAVDDDDELMMCGVLSVVVTNENRKEM